MNYIYDVLVNFDNTLYDFYEWDKEDNINHIRKIPLFKVDKKVLIDITNYKVKLDNSFLNKICNKTEIFSKNKIDFIKYALIISNDENLLVLKLDDVGNIISYSKLLLEEEEDVLNYSKTLEPIIIDYKIVCKNNYEFKTKEEIKIKRYLNKQIKNLIMKKEYEKLEYIYLECFNKKKDIEEITNNIYRELDKNWEFVYIKIYNLFKFTTIR